MAEAELNKRKSLPNEIPVRFRPLTEPDIPSLVEIERLSFTTPWTEEAFYEELQHNQFAQYTVAVQAQRVIGYCGVWLIVDEAHLTNIAVHPQFRGASIGEQLLLYVMTLAKLNGADDMTLEVRPSNKTAIHLYEKLGFVHKGTRPEYYPDDREDAWIMWVNL